MIAPQIDLWVSMIDLTAAGFHAFADTSSVCLECTTNSVTGPVVTFVGHFKSDANVIVSCLTGSEHLNWWVRQMLVQSSVTDEIKPPGQCESTLVDLDRPIEKKNAETFSCVVGQSVAVSRPGLGHPDDCGFVDSTA